MKKMKALLLLLVATLCLGCVTACSDFAALLKPDVSSSLEESESVAGDSSIEEESESTEEESSTEDDNDSTDDGEDKPFGEGYETITVAQALELCGESGNVTTEEYYIIATIDTVSNVTYGAMVVSDETGSISVYNSKAADRTTDYKDMADKPVKGDKVLLSCVLQNHNGTKEIKQAYIIDFEKAVIDDSDYAEMTIADARTAAKGALVKVTGVVAQITYATGRVPSGVMLIDETQSIYVYSSDIAGSVKVGNEITVMGTKDYWILEKEQAAAAKFGYLGCNQISDATLLSNDGKTNEFSLAAIEESTVKSMLETPFTEDCTTIVYKVNALVKKAVGADYVNYLFIDLDGETSSYTYTQCNGSDFAWLDPFDGKICTVYLTALNAKSSDSGCIYRFLPVSVKDEGYTFNTDNAPQFALDYYAVDQFEGVYASDPALEVVTTVSSELLGFEGATLSYQSSNNDVVYFEKVEDKTIFHCKNVGEATITITATYNGKQAQTTVTVKVEKSEDYEYITVAEAIASAVGTEVTVKGVVGPSVINQTAFYLFGEDGSTITVRTTSDTFIGLEIGHEVIFKGTRKTITNGGTEFFGQTAIDDAVLLMNYYGNHEYSTAKFVDTTAADFYALDAKVDYSTTVFVFTAKINFVDEGRYTTLNLTSGGTTVGLYMSGAEDYSWLKDFYGQEVEMEIAACNWNNKKYWRGCILAIRKADGTKVLNTANFDEF